MTHSNDTDNENGTSTFLLKTPKPIPVSNRYSVLTEDEIDENCDIDSYIEELPIT